MSNLDENDQNMHDLANYKRKIANYMFIFTVFGSFYYFVVDDLIVFKPSQQNLTEFDPEIMSPTAYVPIAFDSTEISHGIHIPSGMIADTGCAEVVRNCGACHSLELVKQNRATKDGWKSKIIWMQETQNLWDLGLQEEVILNYLAKNYGPDNSGRRPNLVVSNWYRID